MTTINCKITSKPSNSKGWGRYAVQQGDRNVVESRTSNQFVSADHSGEAAEGSEIILTLQVSLKVGKGRYFRDEITTKKITLIADESAQCEVEHMPGSQGIRLSITGARVASAE